MSNLYEIAQEFRVALSSGDDAAIEATYGTLTTKARNVVAWALERDAQVIAIKSERDRLDALLKAEQNKANWAKEWLKRGMIQSGLDEINLGTMIVKLKNNPPAVEIQPGAIENGVLEARFIRTKIVQEPDKTSIKKAILEDGEVIAGCSITRGQHIEIK